MKHLSEIYPDPQKVIELEPERLGQHVLSWLHSSNEANIKRADVAKTLSSNYHPSFQHKVAHAVEQALGWLVVDCLLGESPYDQDLLYVTDRGKQAASDYQSARPSDVSNPD